MIPYCDVLPPKMSVKMQTPIADRLPSNRARQVAELYHKRSQHFEHFACQEKH